VSVITYPAIVVVVEPRKLWMCIWSQSEVAEAKVQMRAASGSWQRLRVNSLEARRSSSPIGQPYGQPSTSIVRELERYRPHWRSASRTPSTLNELAHCTSFQTCSKIQCRK
jgi:hypothetical protein